MSFTNCLVVMAGGALGTLARYLVSVLALPISGQLPWGTIVINITGSLFIGFFGTLTLASGRFAVSEALRLFVMIGICGGYRTFSSFSLQTLDLVRAGGLSRAALNIGLSVVLCVGAVALGHLMASRLNGGAMQISQVNIGEEA
jgi:CrcB protein